MPLIPDRSDGLLALGAGFQGFLKGMQDAEDRKMKRMEFDAKMKASDSDRQQKEFDKRLEARKSGFLVPENSQDFDPGKLQYDPEYIKMKQQMAQALAGAKPSPAQSSVDSTFGKDYAEYNVGGGKATVDKNLGLLEQAAQELDAPGELGGGLSGLLPDRMQDLSNPKLASTRDKIRSAIQASLKQVLGAQFTEKEGQAIFSRAFNPRLSDAENAKRVRAELQSLSAMAQDKDNAARYYEQHGTLRGFQPTIGKSKGLMKSAPAQSQKPKTVIQNGHTYTLNPQTGEYE